MISSSGRIYIPMIMLVSVVIHFVLYCVPVRPQAGSMKHTLYSLSLTHPIKSKKAIFISNSLDSDSLLLLVMSVTKLLLWIMRFNLRNNLVSVLSIKSPVFAILKIPITDLRVRQPYIQMIYTRQFNFFTI